MAVDGRAGYAERFGDPGRTFPVGTSYLGGSEAGHGSFIGHVALKFGERGYRDEELPFPGRVGGPGQGSPCGTVER